MLISELQVYITLKRKLYLIYIMTAFFKEGEDRHCELCYSVDFFQLLFIFMHVFNSCSCCVPREIMLCIGV